MNTYNTQNPPLILKEYGRNIQKLVEYIKTIDDKDKRNDYAKTLVELMKQVSPYVKDAQDYTQKLWDDLYIMSGYDIEVDSPFPPPDKSVLSKKPRRLYYHNTDDIRYKHYGRNIQILIKKAIEMEDPEEKRSTTIYIGRLMKAFYNIWNKDLVDDTVILDNIKELSRNQLDLDIEEVKTKNLFDATYKERSRQSSNSNNNSGGRQQRRSNNNNNNNNKRRRS